MSETLMLLVGLGLIVASVLAVSGFIISKQPRAKDLIDKIVPFQGFIGVGLLALGVVFLLDWFGEMEIINLIGKHYTLFPWSVYVGTVAAIALGFLFGMPLIAKWIPGDSPAEQKALEMQKKIAGFSTIIGVVGLIFGLLLLYYRFKFS